jgi:general nucleoside transport system ATP-binding protein
MTAPLVMRGITKRFPGVVANDGVSFEAGAGEIHGLLGENGAGKTTLMRILYGLVQPDEGTIEVDGRAVSISSPRDALSLGIGMVHQHFMLVPGMTAAENVALGLTTERALFRPVARVSERLERLAGEFGFGVDPEANVDDLSVGQRQQVEILRLLYRGARIFVLDEPTAALGPKDWERLAAVLRSLSGDGATVILITHKLDELLGVADCCTVLRHGRVVGTVPIDRADKPTLARMMVGRPVDLGLQRDRLEPGEPLLEVRDVSLVDEHGVERLAGIDFDVRRREILGVAGVEGNGQRELVDVLTGMRVPTGGEIRLAGSRMEGPTPREFIARGGAVIPEDRHGVGLALELSLSENLVMKELGRPPLSRRGITARTEVRDWCDELLRDYDVRAPDSDVLVQQLSGGNQQKAILARELSRRPELLVAAHPSRGLDVGALEFVYGRIVEHCEQGGATLLVSNELDEVLSLSDRVAVMVGGRIVRILPAAGVDRDELGLLMAGEAAGA